MTVESIRYLKDENLIPERALYKGYLKEIIQQFGIDAEYFRHDAAFYEEPTGLRPNYIYGEDPTMSFWTSAKIIVYMGMNTDSLLMNKFGIETDGDAECYVLIDEFREQFRDMIGTPIFDSVNITVSANIVGGKGYITGDIVRPELDGYVSIPFDHSDLQVTGPVSGVTVTKYLNHKPSPNPYIKNPDYYDTTRVVTGDITVTWSGNIDQFGNGTITGTAVGDIFYYTSPGRRSGAGESLSPQVGDFFRLGFDSEYGNHEEYEITQLSSKDLTPSGTNPLLSRYMWKMSVVRRDPSHEIVQDKKPADAQEEWTADNVRLTDINEMESNDRFNYDNTVVDKYDKVSSDSVYGGYGTTKDLAAEFSPNCDTEPNSYRPKRAAPPKKPNFDPDDRFCDC